MAGCPSFAAAACAWGPASSFRVSKAPPHAQGTQRRLPALLPPDQDFGARDSVFVPFFGVNTATITGLSRLAAPRCCGVACCPRRGPGRYVLVIEPALTDFRRGTSPETRRA